MSFSHDNVVLTPHCPNEVLGAPGSPSRRRAGFPTSPAHCPTSPGRAQAVPNIGSTPRSHAPTLLVMGNHKGEVD